jgi:outer membrane protein assembly factor BamB
MPNARALLVFCLVVLAVSFAPHRTLAAGDGWLMYGHDAAHTSRSSANGPNTADIKWTYVADGLIRDTVAANGGTIYVRVKLADYIDGLDAVNPDGTLKWSVYNPDGLLASPAVGLDGNIYVIVTAITGSDYLTALDPADGSTLWQFDLGDSSVSASDYITHLLVSADGTIFITSAYGLSGKGTLFAVNPDGTQKWAWQTNQSPLNCTSFFDCILESSPALAPNGNVLIKPYGQGVIALNSTTGAPVWYSDFDNLSFGNADPAGQSLTIGTDSVAYTSEGKYRSNYYALNPADSVKWKYTFSNGADAAISALSAEGSALFHSDNGGILYALDTLDGGARWQYDTGQSYSMNGAPLLAANGIIYFVTHKTFMTPAGTHGYVYALRADSGTLVWRYEVGFPEGGLAMGPDGTLYVPDDTNKLYAFRCANGLCTLPAHTALHTVTTLANSGAGSLRQAIADSFYGDTIQFKAGLTGTIALTTPITANTRVTINGPGAGLITLDGGDAHAVLNVNAGLTINNLTIANGVPGISANGSVYIRNVIFNSNQNPAENGGALVIPDSATVLIEQSVFTNNSASMGGAIYNHGIVRILNSTFSGNSGDFGGAIANDNTLPDDGIFTLVNDTLTGNSASFGGAIYNTGTLSVQSSTLAQNSAAVGGGIYTDSVRPVTFQNALIANNSGGNCDGTLTDGGGNLQYPGSTCGSLPTGDPLLAALANNGGTTLTMALLPGSAAIDAGDDALCAAAPVSNLDQRGAIRPVDGDGNGSAHCDVGAFEVGSLISPPNVAPTLNISTSATPTLTWSHVTDALWYQVEVSQSNTFTSIIQTKATTDGTALFLALDSLAEGTYFWRVHARYANNTWGAWSAVDTFTIDLS